MSKSINQRWSSREMAALFILGLVGGVVLGWSVLLFSAPAYAGVAPDRVSQSTWAEPYGGCDEAYLYPATRGAWECRVRGLGGPWWVSDLPVRGVR